MNEENQRLLRLVKVEQRKAGEKTTFRPVRIKQRHKSVRSPVSDRLQLRIEKGLHRSLVQYARENKLTKSQVIRAALLLLFDEGAS